MYRLSLIISEVYNKFLPLAEKNGIELNMDFIDRDIVAEELTGIRDDVEKAISEAIGRSAQGEITIQVNQNEIIISDTGTTLSRPVCALLSGKYVNVSSRVGFGTKVRISLKRTPKELKDSTEQER